MKRLISKYSLTPRLWKTEFPPVAKSLDSDVFWSTSRAAAWAPFQHPTIRLTVRSHEVSDLRDVYLEFPDRSEIWQAPRQHCGRSVCQISMRCDNLNYQYRSFETSRDLPTRRLNGYWNRVLVPIVCLLRPVFLLRRSCNGASSPLLWVPYNLMKFINKCKRMNGCRVQVACVPFYLQSAKSCKSPHWYSGDMVSACLPVHYSYPRASFIHCGSSIFLWCHCLRYRHHGNWLMEWRFLNKGRC